MGKKRKAKRPAPTVEEVLKKHLLPSSGPERFVPPKNWHPSQPLHRGAQKGFMDDKGREYKKGPPRTPGQHFEWDVQLPGGGHLNVDWDGNITHPKP
jgi:filamentous hemagglutinin